MRIVFNDNRGDENLGSTRIFVHNLHYWLSQLGYDVHLNDWTHYTDYDVAIFGKNVEAAQIQEARARNPKLVCGCIHPNDVTSQKKAIMKQSDFFIAGCHEERDYYLRYNKNVFILLDLERMFTRVKKHEDHEPIVLGYHGNLDHLAQFQPYLKPALETLAREIPIKLLVVFNKKQLGPWRVGRPAIEIEEVQWDIETIEEQLLRCDIGLVPGLTPISPAEKRAIFGLLKCLQRRITSYKHDYLLRFKNTSNSGRAYVFHQLGIPVISDFLPSSFHILADPRCGYLAHSTEGWVSALRDLCQSAEKRQKIAQNALAEFQRHCDPLEWSQRLYEDIENLWQRLTSSPSKKSGAN
jgi:hypothetical protein